MIRTLTRILPAFLLLFFSGCAGESREHHARFFVFGTIMDITLWDTGESTAGKAFSRLQDSFQNMHRDWHAWEPGLLVDINQAFADGEPAPATPAIIELTRRSQSIEDLTGGRFNAAIGALIGLWGFHTSDYPILGPPPDKAAIGALLDRRPSSLDIQIRDDALFSGNTAVQLDFGGIAKGYAIDLACETLDQLGISNAIVNAGGDLRVIGRHGDRPWRVAVRNPAGGIIGVLEPQPGEAVFTSGIYERFRQEDDQRYPHILDPRTGWPVEELASVTVISDEGLLADAAATALIVAGLDQWVDVARALELSEVMMVDATGVVYLTAEMNERIVFEKGVETELVTF